MISEIYIHLLFKNPISVWYRFCVRVHTSSVASRSFWTSEKFFALLRIRRIIITRRIISSCFNYPGSNKIHRNDRSSCNRPRLPVQSSKMALRQGAWPSLPLLAPMSILWQPRASARSALTVSRRLTSKMLIQLAIPISVSLTIPPILFGIWDSILRAVPKKKTSHRKKRQRFMAGNALKDVLISARLAATWREHIYYVHIASRVGCDVVLLMTSLHY